MIWHPGGLTFVDRFVSAFCILDDATFFNAIFDSKAFVTEKVACKTMLQSATSIQAQHFLPFFCERYVKGGAAHERLLSAGSGRHHSIPGSIWFLGIKIRDNSGKMSPHVESHQRKTIISHYMLFWF